MPTNLSVAVEEPSVQVDDISSQYWTNVDNKVMIWDDPSMVGGIRHPKHYKPLSTVQSVLNKYENGTLKADDIVILKILGDAICANEDQLRRYLELNNFSRSKVSDRLKRFRSLGMASRWYVRSQVHPDDKRPPAPFTLGLGGFNLLKDRYGSERYFAYPDHWYKWGVKVVQRYVAMNEVRLQLAENRYLTGWEWNAVLAGSTKNTRPHGVAEIKTKQGRVNFIIERGQQTKDFLTFFQDKIEKYSRLYNKYGSFEVYHNRQDETVVNTNKSVLVLYCSTRSLAVTAMQELDMKNANFPIWFLVEEDLVGEGGINKAFLVPQNGKLRRFNLETMV
ncbi:replication-relaxation family protein [Pontibacillus halophilus]|uniref:replication-relaxation family protein n=1 Tax=Pontibacillus halophilus TaxID=516704 RepID=UPI00047D58DF|nr:replication-relaxation family protein [Pontibacillus halophilus]